LNQDKQAARSPADIREKEGYLLKLAEGELRVQIQKDQA
jgi:hypothetical protein